MDGTEYFGVIDEGEFSLRSPRGIDGDECATLRAAFKAAFDMIEDGAKEVAVVRAAYSERHQAWVEMPEFGFISIDAFNAREGFGLGQEE